MKRCFFIFLLILCLLPGLAGAEEEDALYPIRENGLWGYMNRTGETVIPPQLDDAGQFSQGRAIAARCDASGKIRYGIIDGNGEWLLQSRYFRIEDTPFCYFIYSEDALMGPVGWLDKNSGFFQAPKYAYLWDNRTDCGLILAEWREENGEYRDAYLRRDTGEIAILLAEQGELYPDAAFSEGYAFILFELWEDESFIEYLMDQKGNKAAFPAGIYPNGSVNEGVLRISDGNGKFGLARPDGTVIVPPQYEYVENASEGRTFFYQDDKLGILDLEGNVILPASLNYDPGWDYFGGGEQHFFFNGYALVKQCDENKVRSWVIVDREGKTVFAYPSVPEKGTSFAPCAYVMENGLLWYRVGRENGKNESYGLIRLSGEGWAFLTEPIFDDIPDSDCGKIVNHDGLMPVSQNGQYGYINEQASWVIPPQWDHAWEFESGLAPVEKDGKLAYIDHAGTVVWQEAPMVYYNANGGKYYHADPCCPRVSPLYWPLSPVLFEKINEGKFLNLLPCSICCAPERPSADAAQ